MDEHITVYGVSDLTGETVSRVVRAASAQFPAGSVRVKVLAHATFAQQVIDFVDADLEADGRCAVFHTILDPQMREDLRNALQTQGIASVDLLGMPAHVMGDLLGRRPVTTPGLTIEDGAVPTFVDLAGQ